MAEYKQLQKWLVCQICGCFVSVDDEEAEQWLVGTYRRDPSGNVKMIRCPRHWSEWSLRMSGMKRTFANRRKMAAGKLMPPSGFKLGITPFPINDSVTMPADEKMPRIPKNTKIK